MIYSFLGNVRITPHHCSGKRPRREYPQQELCEPILPTIAKSPDPAVLEKDQESKARRKAKANANAKRRPKLHDLHIGESVLARLRIPKKASPPFVRIPYSIRGISDSMITGI